MGRKGAVEESRILNPGQGQVGERGPSIASHSANPKGKSFWSLRNETYGTQSTFTKQGRKYPRQTRKLNGLRRAPDCRLSKGGEAKF